MSERLTHQSRRSRSHAWNRLDELLMRLKRAHPGLMTDLRAFQAYLSAVER